MSAGNFLDAFYEDDLNNVYNCRTQPETAALVLNGITNSIPAGPADMPVSARLTGSRRAIGCRARSVRVRFTGEPPTGYKADQIIELPIYRAINYVQMSAVPKPTGTYLGAAVQATGFTGESRV